MDEKKRGHTWAEIRLVSFYLGLLVGGLALIFFGFHVAVAIMTTIYRQ
jgi:hypothetical protein